MSDSLIELKERIPKIGEFYVALDGTVWLCLGFSSYKYMLAMKVGGTVLVDSFVLNFEKLYPHLVENTNWFFASKENFVKANWTSHQALSIKTLRKNDVAGKVIETAGVVDGFSVDVQKLTLRLNKLRMLGLIKGDIRPHEYYQDIERSNRDKEKRI